MATSSDTLTYNFVAVAAVNLLFFGSGYLFLRRYARFFLVVIVALVTTIIHPLLWVIAYAGVIADCARLAMKYESTKEPLPSFNLALHSVAIFTIIFLIMVVIFPPSFFAYSEESCDFLAPVEFSLTDMAGNWESIGDNQECKRAVKDGRTLFTFLLPG